MDKYEYKIKEDEIKELIKMQEFEEAAEVADTVDWRRVKSVKILCIVSDVYKKLRRYEDSRDMLLLAYDRHPGGRTIVYSLCELAIKMGDLGQALEYCKEFIKLAPKDPGRYILQYKLYEAQEVGLEERIAVLEELKKRDYREKWAYELAYLYHLVGMETKCVEECDELIVWFGDGKYVIKAMELKMLHQPLTPQQQEKYDNRFAEPEPVAEPTPAEEETVVPAAETIRIPVEEIDIQVKTLGLSQCDTINLQAEVAAGLKEYLDNQKPQEGKDIDFEMANTSEFMMGVMATTEIVMDEEEEQSAEEATEEPLADETIEFVEDAEVEELAEAEEATEVQEEEAAEESEEAPAEALTEEPESTIESAEESASEEPAKAQIVQKPEELDWQAAEMAKVLSVEGDGQISFVVPESVAIEKQITGQMNFDDIMLEWERMKLELEEKRKENVRQMVLKNTGAMFTEFEASVRDGLLEQLENGKSMEEILPQAESLSVDAEEADEAIDTEESVQEAEGFEDILTEEASDAQETEDDISTEEVVFEVEEFTEDSDEDFGEDVAEETLEEEESSAEEDLAEEVTSVEEISDEEISAEELSDDKDASVEENSEAEERTETSDVVEELVEIDEDTNEDDSDEDEEDSDEDEEDSDEDEEDSDEDEEDSDEDEEDSDEDEEDSDEDEEDSDEDEEDLDEDDEDHEVSAEELLEIAEALEEELAEAAGEIAETPKKEQKSTRNLTKEERELFAPFIQGRSSKEQLIQVLDNISLAAYTGNVVITGREGLDTIGMARSIVRNLQQEDKNFSGKVAKISGNSLNKRNVPEILEGLINGALIIQKAGDINEATAKSLYKVLQQETRGIVVILEGTKRAINAFFEEYSILEPCFNARIDMEALTNEALVAFAKKYAREQECSIDEFGMLALHRTITERQTSDHAVTIMEVKEIMDGAIESANRKTLSHFFSVLAAKRYDDEDMIIIREKDFM